MWESTIHRSLHPLLSSTSGGGRIAAPAGPVGEAEICPAGRWRGRNLPSTRKGLAKEKASLSVWFAKTYTTLLPKPSILADYNVTPAFFKPFQTRLLPPGILGTPRTSSASGTTPPVTMETPRVLKRTWWGIQRKRGVLGSDVSRSLKVLVLYVFMFGYYSCYISRFAGYHIFGV